MSGLPARLTDFGETRLAAMDGAGIARSVLAIAGPGAQSQRESTTARRRAREVNDFLAREIAKKPYPEFAHLLADTATADASCARPRRHLALVLRVARK